MRKKLKLLLVAATLALTIGIISLGGGVVSAPAKAAGSGTLAGFTSSGASVYIATDGTDAKQMRFQIDLTADKAAYAGEGKTAGVVYIPLDVYNAKGVTELTKDTPDAITADVTKNWAANADGSYSSYAYLDPRFIPAGQENRTLVARGYIVDGENVYYTDEVKASMAYVAWKNLDMEEGKYADQLKKYMGPYTLTYGDDGKIENLYYGDTFTLPTSIGTDTVDKWYWDLACTQEIKPTDYATGSMKIYYELRKVAVSGTIACADSSVDLTKTEIYANGKKLAATINASGNYTVNVSIKNAYDLVFKNGNYLAYGNVTVGDDAVTDVNATLKPNTFDIGDFGSVKSSTDVTYDKNAALDGSVTVGGSNVMLVMPNTATSETFAYEVKVNNVTRTNDEATVGICITDGKNRLAVGCRRYDVLEICMGATSGEDHNAFYGKWEGHNTTDGATLRFEVKKNEICFYVNGTLRFTFTKDSITPNGVDYHGNWGDSLKDVYKSMIAGFFADNAKIAVGINSGWKFASTATYNYSIIDMQTVTGTVAAPSGSTDFDLTKVKVYADGKLTEATVAADGTFSLVIPEGVHDFSFETEGYIAYSDGVTVGKDAAPITATLADNTFAIGKHGSITSTTGGYDRTAALDGSVTVEKSSGHYTLVMPNTATAGEREYTVKMMTTETGGDDYYFGFGLSNGNNVLSFTFSKWAWLRVGVYGYEKVYPFTSEGNGSAERTYKIVRTKDEIKLYVNGSYALSVTKDGVVAPMSQQWDEGAAANADYASFFGDSASLALTLVTNGPDGGASKRTYSYSIGEVAKASGTISKPAGVEDIDLTSVKVYANGTDTRATVSADGKFSFTHIAGTYDIAFELPDYSYVAYAEDTVISTTTAPINVTLVDGTNAIGNYGNIKSSTDGYKKSDALDKTLTVSGSNKLLVVPNSATTDGFIYEVTVNGINRDNPESTIGACITDGKYRLSIGCRYEWGVQLSLSDSSADNNSAWFGVGGNRVDGMKIKFVVTKADIKLYVNDGLWFIFAKDGMSKAASWVNTLDWGDSLTSVYADRIAGFFADDAKIAVGINSGWKYGASATYTYSVTKYKTVSGAINLPEGADLGTLSLKVDGVETPITVDTENKTYSAQVLVGTHTFEFANSVVGQCSYKATKTDVNVIDGTNTIDVAASEWGENVLWQVGNYGSVSSNNATVATTSTADGKTTATFAAVSGSNQMLIMPNTATSEAFTYEVTVSDLARENDESTIGICVTDGNNRLTVGFRKTWGVELSLDSVSADGANTWYGVGGDRIEGMKLKFVVTKADIKLYVNDGLWFTFTKDGIEKASFVNTLDWGDSLTGVYADRIAGFFADDAKIAVGINSGWKYGATATYTCSITKN